ncbi:protein CUP-SHAPED COTYLEDON 3 [Cannabis sativa]|uniref:protein CUP-SHAPED COTYLEDON 3 n=1 Tax=Cannabis sativa TaxID=3483 RepID=UPI0029CA0398|nr:protein CUP-SHAPED COTYLEDON 3 [Cannabis sativa]
MGLRDIGATLPPGFRFYPSDEELVCHYLYKKICNEEILKGTLVEIDLHTCEPWQLPDVAKLNASEWYFFSFRDRKYATGYRTNRATTCGYWKATGKDRTVVDPLTKDIVGMRKTLVFYRNRAPNGVKTGWIMHEFRLETPHMPPKEDWVLCRVFHKSKESSSENMNNNINQGINNSQQFNHLSSISSSPPTIISDHHQQLRNLGNNNYDDDHDQIMINNNHHDFSIINNNIIGTSITNVNAATTTTEISSTTNDDYAFIWGINNNFNDDDQIREFDLENSMVFL